MIGYIIPALVSLKEEANGFTRHMQLSFPYKPSHASELTAQQYGQSTSVL